METTPYIVGSWYQVPTVHGFIYRIKHAWPVMGPMHEDAEIIRFPHQHYHIDWRFVPQHLLNRVSDTGFVLNLAGLVLMTNKYGAGMNPEGLPEPISKRLLCKRELDDYPKYAADRMWLRGLEDKYQDCKLKAMVCPHKGLPLDKLPCKHDGTVTCPGHGLTWNAGTGEMVRYTK